MRTGSIRSRAAGTDAAIVEVILERTPESVLDVGCGDDDFARQSESIAWYYRTMGMGA